MYLFDYNLPYIIHCFDIHFLYNLLILFTHTNISGFTALHLAIVKSRNDVAKMLISELGAKAMGPVTENGINAAHVAASSGMQGI